MADRTLTINHADGDSETYTINRDKFAGVREMSIDGSTVTVDHTATPKAQSKETTFGGSQSITIKRDIEPLLTKVVGGASAAYSLRDLNGKANTSKVVRVRRESDNNERDFTAKEVSNGTLQNWTNAQVTPPLDLRELTATGRDGPIIEAAAAYSLRNLSESYTGSVVEVRRSSDGEEDSFTASDVADGTLTDWVSEDPIAQNSTSNPYSTFTNASATGFTATLSSGIACAGFGGVSGSSGDSVTVSFDLDIVSGSPLVALREGTELIDNNSNSQVCSSSGSYSLTMTATGDFGFIGFSEGDIPSEFTVSNFEITSVSGATYVRDGFVSKWYDQSGNDNHATQGTPASQPKIVDGGSLVSGGIDFDGVNDELVVSGNPVITANSAGTYSAFSVQKVLTSNRGYLYGNASTTDGSSLYASHFGVFGLSNKNAASNYDIIARDGNKSLLSAVYNNGDAGMLVNGGGTMTDAGIYDFDAGSEDFIIGNRNGGTSDGTRLDGTIQEIIVYNSDQSDNRTAIEANIGETYSIDLPSGVDTGYDQVDGFVETWYDQSGNGNDATQSVAGSQPKIVDGGTLVTTNGNPTVDFYDTCFLETDAFLDGSAHSSFAAINNQGATSTRKIFYGKLEFPNKGFTWNYRGDRSVGEYDSVSYDGIVHNLTFSNSTSPLHFVSSLLINSTKEVFINSTSAATSSDSFVADDGTLIIGSLTLGTGFDIQEIIIYPSDQSANRLAIEANINNQYDIY